MGSTRFSQQELKNLDWDDTALIEAYDKAKAKAAAKIKKLKKKSSEKPSTSEEKEKQWEVGSYCRALYSEDGYYYEAKVLELDNEGFCTVEFLGYDDIEEAEVKKLKHSRGKKARKDQIKSVMETSAMSLTCAESDAESEKSESASVASSAAKEKGWKKYAESHQPMKYQPAPPFPDLPFWPHTMPMMAPPPPMGPMMAPPPPMGPMMAPPPIAPPPIPPMHGFANDPALGALVRSWYLAGYYYGRYEQATQRETSYSGPCCRGHANQCCHY